MFVIVAVGELANALAGNVHHENMQAAIVVPRLDAFACGRPPKVTRKHHGIAAGRGSFRTGSGGNKGDLFSIRRPSHVVSLPDRKSTRLNSSLPSISYAVFCLKKKKKKVNTYLQLTN